MNNRWSVSRSHKMVQWLQSQGVVFWTGPREIALAQKYTKQVFEVFLDLTVKVHVLYLFSQTEQTGNDRGCDGICWWREHPGGMQFAIGLAVEALDSGRNYFVGLFLHELAHLTNGPHNLENFYSYLDEMAAQYRRRTGEPVYPDHRDFEPDAPPGGPGRPRKAVYSVAGGCSAEAARRRMIERKRQHSPYPMLRDRFSGYAGDFIPMEADTSGTVGLERMGLDQKSSDVEGARQAMIARREHRER